MVICQISIFHTYAFSVIIGSIALIYIIYFSWIRKGWNKIQLQQTGQIPDKLKITVIIAARNEEANLASLLKNLEKQNFPASNFEVLIIDDHSECPIKNLPAVKESKLTTLSILDLPEDHNGKKAALEYGAKQSKYDYLLFTDADCRVPIDWIASHASSFWNNKADLNIGLVDQESSGKPASVFYRLEFLALMLSGAGSAGQSHPTLCNGANLSVQKSLYLESIWKLFKNIPSGDDVFLLHALKQIPQCRISVLKNKDAIVLTPGPQSIKTFLQQRLRWGSKGSKYKDRDTILMTLLVLIANLSLIACLVAAILDINFLILLLVFFLGKTGVDARLILSGLTLLGGRKQIFLIPLFELIYPFYVSLTAVASLILPYRWKKRKA